MGFWILRAVLGCPVVPLFPFWGALGSLIKPLQAKKGTLFKPWLLGSLVFHGPLAWALKTADPSCTLFNLRAPYFSKPLKEGKGPYQDRKP